MPKFTMEDKLNPLFEAPEDVAKDDQAQPKRRPGRPKNGELIRGNGPQAGLTEEYSRYTMIITVDLLDRIKNIAYTERRSIKDLLEELLAEAVAKKEKQLKAEGIEILSYRRSFK